MKPEQVTILVIENDERLAGALAIRLKNDGYRVVTAHAGSQGMAAFDEQHIDLVITDLNMPSGNGADVAKSMRRHSNVPIIVITGFRDAFARELRGIPNISILEKPFSWTSLSELVEAQLILDGRLV